MFLFVLGIVIIIGVVAYFRSSGIDWKEWKTWLIIAVAALVSIVCLFAGMKTIINDEPSRWSQLSDEEQDRIRDNVQWGHDIGVLD